MKGFSSAGAKTLPLLLSDRPANIIPHMHGGEEIFKYKQCIILRTDLKMSCGQKGMDAGRTEKSGSQSTG